MLQNNYINHLETLKQKILNKKYNFKTENISVLTGVSSRLIFLAQLGKTEGKEAFYEELISNDIDEILNHIERKQVLNTNLEGLVGFGSAIIFIHKLGYLQETEQTILSELDDFIIEAVKIEFAENNYDYFYGGLGYLYYLILHPNKSKKIIKCLEGLFENDIFKNIILKDFSSFDRERNGFVDFSGVHGLASIVFFLNKLIAINVKTDQCKVMLNNCCEYILINRTLGEEGLRIPDYLDNDTPKFSPLRWCHGELGMIYSLTEAAKHLEDDNIHQILKEVLITISKFELNKQQELVSPNICHGTLGVAHIFNRLNKLYPYKEVKEAAKYWYQKSDEIMNSKIGYTDNDDNGVFIEKTGLLMGIEGMALAILSYIYPNQTNWDYQILLK